VAEPSERHLGPAGIVHAQEHDGRCISADACVDPRERLEALTGEALGSHDTEEVSAGRDGGKLQETFNNKAVRSSPGRRPRQS
jgi:hypothetical protein